MVDVRLKNMVEMMCVHDEHPVEAFAAHGSNPALSVGVSARRTNRSLDQPDPFAGEDLVEGAGELGVAVTDEELHLPFSSGRPAGVTSACRLRACWVTQSPAGLGVIPARCTRRLFSSMKNST